MEQAAVELGNGETPVEADMGMTIDLLDLSHVPRWTTHPVARPQSVAEHSYRVAILVNRLAGLFNEQPDRFTTLDLDITMRAVWWALLHDGPEVKTGDLPHPAKRMIGAGEWERMEEEACPWYRWFKPDPNGIVYRMVQLADVVEALTWMSRYGQGCRDRFNGEDVVGQLRARIGKAAEEADKVFPGLGGAVKELVKETCE